MSKKKFTKLTIILVLSAALLFGVDYFTKKIKHSKYFTVKQVVIKGIFNTNKKKADREAKKFIGKNIFEINLNKPFFIDDKWVKKIKITKKFPDKLVISIFEKKSSFVFNKYGKCYHFIKGDNFIKTNCKNTKIFLKGKVDKTFLEEFSKIFNTYNYLQSSKIILYPSYFSIETKNYKIKSPYNEKIFSANFEYFNKGIKNRYSKIYYVDMRISGKIYVNGVTNETG